METMELEPGETMEPPPMPERAPRSAPGLVTLRVDGEDLTVPAGTTVAAALVNRSHQDPAGFRRLGFRRLGFRRLGFRRSVRGELRGPLCGMGICFECRATVNGHPHVRTCMTTCRDGMVVLTDA